MAQKKFVPPNTVGARFKPPGDCSGTSLPETSALQPEPAVRCLGSIKTRFGSEALMTDGKRFWLKIFGQPTASARFLTDADDHHHFGQKFPIEAEFIGDWLRAHGITPR